MARDWEDQFRAWAKPPGKTEQDRCSNAESAIRNAIKASDKLKNRDIAIFTQGSYRNNTNVRKDSDVDVGILCKDVFFHQLPEGLTESEMGFTDGTYKYAQFKNEVEEALVNHFGRTAVTRGNKAIDVHETSYHVEADVAPFIEHRRYNINKTYISGVELHPDNGGKIINWPEQHYVNGCQKNNDTGTRYKSIVRALKALSNEMTEAHVSDADVPGFLIECLVWNVPNDRFQHSTYVADVKAALVFLYKQTKTDDLCKDWGEVSELKYLFRGNQKWTREQANAFAVAAWQYAEMEGQS